MVIETDSPPTNPAGDFEDFFRNFEEIPNEFKYRQRISDAYAKSEHHITVLFEDILAFNPQLAHYLKNHPEEALEEASEALKNIIRIDAGGFFNPDEAYFVRISTLNNSNEVSLRRIRSEHVDTLIYVKGIVIRASIIRPQVIRAMFECPICGNQMLVDQLTTRLTPPRECMNPTCNNKKDFKVLTEQSEFLDHQYVTIQEAPEELRSGDIPQTLQAVLLNDLVDSVRPGERVKMMGILKSVPREDRRGRLSTLFQSQLFVNNVEGIRQEDEELDLSQEDIDEIHALAQEPDIQNKIANSIARAILGHEKLKMAAALSLFGGNQKLKKDGSRLRGDIHVLFMGDPGTGKSQILQNCAQIATRSVYTSGKGASAAGLTAAVIKENDNAGLQLEAGALVLASGGVACIDEFDKMRKQDRSAIHEAMEQQTISIAKAGIVATLQSKTAIIAAANPKHGRWNEYETPANNINLNPPILSRFDLIFIVRDIPEKNMDDRIADYILKNHMMGFDETYYTEDEDENSQSRKQIEFIPIDLLKKYVQYAKVNSHPKLTREPANLIRDFYISMRSSTPEGSTAVPIVARTLDGMVRMSEAYAKMALRDFVKKEDAEAVIELLKKSLRDIGYDEETNQYDVDVMYTGTSSSKRQKLNLILNKIKELQTANPKAELTFEDIFEPLAHEKGITEEFVRAALDQWVKDSELYNPHPNTWRMTNPPKKSKENLK
ncbi:MAG: minichromosome maintenance protein MCM [Promethearchaeota archaeon]